MLNLRKLVQTNTSQSLNSNSYSGIFCKCYNQTLIQFDGKCQNCGKFAQMAQISYDYNKNVSKDQNITRLLNYMTTDIYQNFK